MRSLRWMPWAATVFAAAVVVALMALLAAPTLLAARALLVGAGALLAAAAVPLVHDALVAQRAPPAEAPVKLVSMHPRKPG